MLTISKSIASQPTDDNKSIEDIIGYQIIDDKEVFIEPFGSIEELVNALIFNFSTKEKNEIIPEELRKIGDDLCTEIKFLSEKKIIFYDNLEYGLHFLSPLSEDEINLFHKSMLEKLLLKRNNNS